MNKVLITGATGFIGSWLTKFFLENGKDVVAHGSSCDSIEKLKQFLKNIRPSTKIEYWAQNFFDQSWNFPDLSKISAIIHCAAATKIREGTTENYDKYFELNALATKRIAKKALESKIDHFIYVSSGQVFGIPSNFPITELTPKNPINLYGYTKLIAESIICSLGGLGLNFSIVRPFSVYGIGHNNIISIITEKVHRNEKITVYGDGAQTRSFMHINDVCKAIELILGNKKCYGEDYNLSGLKEYSVNELIRLISNKFNTTPTIEYKKPLVNELKRNFANTRKLKELGFHYSESLEDFIEKNIN